MTMKWRHLAFALLLAWIAPALGDTCIFLTHVEGQSPDGRYKVRADLYRSKVRADLDQGWKCRVEDTRTGRATDGFLQGLGFHAHFSLFVTDNRIAFFEPSIDQWDAGNLLIYDRGLKLLKRFTLRDLHYPSELGGISHSISHCRFTRPDPARRRPAWLEGGVLMIHLESRRTARVSLKDLAIIPTPEFVPRPAEPLEDAEPAALSIQPDRKRLQGRWKAVEVTRGPHAGRHLLEDDPVYVLVEADRIALSDNRDDLKPFRLDPTAHTIDFDGKKGLYSLENGVFKLCCGDDPRQPRPKNIDNAGVEYAVYVLKRVKEEPDGHRPTPGRGPGPGSPR
jgi:uncharacterized protein (TIGR03067 family)